MGSVMVFFNFLNRKNSKECPKIIFFKKLDIFLQSHAVQLLSETTTKIVITFFNHSKIQI